MSLAFRPVDPVEDVLNRLAHFRRIAFGVRTDFEAELIEWFGFAPRQARIVAVLHAAAGPVGRDALIQRARVGSYTLRKDLFYIRQALGEGCLPPCDRETGVYQLTQAGRRACDEAVEHVGLAYLRGRLVA